MYAIYEAANYNADPEMGVNVIAPGLKSFFKLDLLCSFIIMCSVTTLICKRVFDNKNRDICWQALPFITLLFAPLFNLIVSAMAYADDSPFINNSIYLYKSTGAGAAGAAVGWVGSLIMLPALIVAYRTLEGRWPQYSFRALLLFFFILLGLGIWSHDYFLYAKHASDLWHGRWYFFWKI
jgi:hypothetical protein